MLRIATKICLSPVYHFDQKVFDHKIYILPSIIYPYIYYIILVVGWTERP